MKILLLSLSLLLSDYAWSMGKKTPADLSALTGSFRQLSCNMDTIPYPSIPHTIDFNGHANGSAQIVLRTKSKVLTTRSFAIQDRKNQKCFDNGDYSAKCKAKSEAAILKLDINWKCHIWPFCIADTPEDYTFQINSIGNMVYSQDDFVCEYTRVSNVPLYVEL